MHKLACLKSAKLALRKEKHTLLLKQFNNNEENSLRLSIKSFINCLHK